MLTFNSEIPKPKNADDFEQFCLIVYRVVYGDKNATRNGRSGQKQYGVDIFVHRQLDRIGIQCKRINLGELTVTTIDAEVDAANKGEVDITELVIATTAPNDTKLIQYAHELSKKRREKGGFPVSLAFWDTLESHVQESPELQFHFAPGAAGGAFYKASQEHRELMEITREIRSAVTQSGGILGSDNLPDARKDSLNKVITVELDDIRRIIISGRFQDALDRLKAIASSIHDFDEHQKFRWHSQRASCYWRLGDKRSAADEYERAYPLASKDDKAVANYIRAPLLRGDIPAAFSRATDGIAKFPSSASVWSAWANVQAAASKPVDISSVPPELREVGEMLHTFAWINLRNGNGPLAVEQSLRSLRTTPESFDSRSLFLVCALSLATGDQIRTALSSPAESEKNSLQEAIEIFKPFRDKLWVVQDRQSLAEALLHLSYALQLTSRIDEARELLEEGIREFPKEKCLRRAMLECIQRDGRDDDSYAYGIESMEELDEPGLALLAEMAANRGDLSTVQIVRERVAASSQYARLKEDVESMLWQAMWRNKKNIELKELLDKSDLQTTLSMTKLSVAARIYWGLEGSGSEAVKETFRRMTALLHKDSASVDVLQHADASLYCRRFAEAAELYQRVVPDGAFGDMHEKYFQALVKSGKRRKALLFLKAAPPGSMFKENMRDLAVELASSANDWEVLRELAEFELKTSPERADAWLFRAVVHLHQSELQPLKVLLGKAPIELTGSARAIANLANFEIRFDYVAKGLGRTYRKYRQEPGDTDAASALFFVSVNAPSTLMQEAVAQVEDGTTVTLSISGEQRIVTIDPRISGTLPAHAEFIAFSDDLAKQMLGRSVGDKFEINDTFGFVRSYEIVAIQSAFLAIGRRVAEQIQKSVKPVKGVLSVPIPTGADGKPDFQHVLSQLKMNSTRIEAGFNAYRGSPLTVGALAKALGTNAPGLAGDWPSKPAPALYVFSGKNEERIRAELALKERPASAVIDLMTLAELTACDCEGALALVAPVYISRAAADIVNSMVDEVSDDKSPGSLREEKGQIVLTENTQEFRAQRKRAIEKIREAMAKYCVASPTYGPENIPEDIQQISSVLDSESFDAVLLALEHKGLLITLDGRLREIAERFGKISGIWPQILLAEAREKNVINQAAYSWAIEKQLVMRRTHIAVAPADILWILRQSEFFLQAGIRAVKEHFSDSRVDPNSAFRIAIQVIEGLLRSPAQLGAVAEVVEHLFGAVFAHPGVGRDEASEATKALLGQILDSIFKNPNSSRIGGEHISRRHYAWRELLLGAVEKAGNRAKGPVEDLIQDRIYVKNLFCLRTPSLIYAGLERMDQAGQSPAAMETVNEDGAAKE